ncbi:hypothetical protein ACJMK2_023273 [Sinanodonta woodiana]|uniref:Granulins domain-containing protein n=1 Tax=Sinanodonta woodiana TaxID=1069815 RepID=A0ABD3T597_SINWO
MDGLLPLLLMLVGSSLGNKLYFISQNQPGLKQENVQRKPVETVELKITDPSVGTYFRKPLHSRLEIKKQDVICPDGEHLCQEGETCCKGLEGTWACCQSNNAVCCDDHLHCCPQGMNCDSEHKKCVMGSLRIDWMLKHSSKKSKPMIMDKNLCPGSSSECQSTNTCCQLATGNWGCCNIEGGVCCDDRLHCCPVGFRCELKQKKCLRGNFILNMTQNTPAINTAHLAVKPLVTMKSSVINNNLQNVICPDEEHQCLNGNTCCQLTSGQWGCCPLEDAVCCSDHLHCCPHGTKCDVSEGKCIQGDIVTDWFEKTPASKKDNVSVGSVVCPDKQHECPDGNTCCKLASGDWGCCPLEKAVCCSDHLHCCPHGTKCDVSEGKCIQGDIVTDWFEKTPASIKDNVSVGSVVCPDKQHECPDGNTCCKLASGDWGCCPLEKAVCCSDHLHCCPHGTKCDVSEGKCLQGDIVTDWFEKTPASKKDNVSVGSVVCPDKQHECPDGNTCCKLASGDWGCCPLEKAVCCSDHLHCCPHGTKCDVSEGKCLQGNIAIDWFEKTPASKNDSLSVGSVVCPDGQHECPDGNTCCKLSSGDWGCCPLEKAVCCSDHLHCCPHGTKCDVSEGKCIQGDIVTDWFEKTAASKKDNVSVGSVVCPDGQHECPDGNTCCKLSSGDWGCCPLEKAVCCSDHLHCCPHGTKCDVSEGKCLQGNIAIDWFEKTAASKKDSLSVGSVVCPDGQHECPDGNTCCKLASGDWGCCPLEKAVCCSDHLHCCPHGTKCDVSEGKCIQGDIATDWFEKTPASKKDNVSVGSVVCPDKQHECPDGNTCCKLASGDWGCCPLEKAVCCSDHLHCCPHGTKCDVSEGKCIQGDIVTDWFEKRPASKKDILSVGSVICPDGQHECPDGNTCCKLASGDWGCCPLEKAVCCSDHLHCCPHGTKCDVSEGKCIQGDIVTDWFEKTPASIKDNISVGSVVCPDKQHECPDGNTCCKLASGDWGCCPLEKAVCCSDHLHCCPHGTKCDVSEGKCIQGDIVTDWFEKRPASKKDILSVGSVICPDGQHECPDGNTCCKLASGDWGCCPLEKAVCCSDHLHCCPHGTKCDVSEGKCIQGDIVTDWFEKTPASIKDNISVGSVVCPDKQHECPDGNTCCKLASGDWGCCPLEKAVCCSDHLHCCPHGTKCDVSEGKCLQGNIAIDWFEKTPASKNDSLSVGSVVCPDGQHECPDGNTCCKLSSGDWGCCPLEKAVCCSDHLHCCPHGTKCDVSEGKCLQGNIAIDWFEKTPASKKDSLSVGSVVCPDGQHECPDGNTCCKLASGDWGCCPLEKAVCCSDHLHCCPHGTKCDVSEGKCLQGNIAIDWFDKTPASKKDSLSVGSVVCPDGQHECPDGNTCCKLSSGDWGCCPLEKAVCCSDHLHCCPHGTKCDVSEGKCLQGNIAIDWFEKTPASEKDSLSVGSVVCPDGQHECPDGNTCCKLASGDWGCCPLEKAVCCSDHLHCCPHGTKCDVSEGKCIQGDIVTDWFEKTPASKKDNVSVGSVVCPDKQHECPDGNTCCKLASGDWGCCPLEKAVCCSDHLHCCPHGTKCDVSEGKCIQGDIVTDWFEKTPASIKDNVSVGSVVCPDKQHECPDGNTCCKLASGDWGCCPLEKAVCCSDHLHCCPHGTKCDVSEGKCIQGDIVTDWFEKTPASKKDNDSVGSVVCPDKQHECPDGNTCCKLASGDWGCCPLEKAVCCSDHLHCCPHGTKCDVSEGKCLQGNIVTDWFEKTPASKKDSLSVGSVVCPDGQHECPDGNTCCKLSSGDWGCCPLEKAVCCSDHLHCCPHGTKCDVSEGKCLQGNIAIDWFEKTAASKKDSLSVGSVVCPDGQHECPDGNTCCKLSSGDWGCCPLEKAVCCSDHLHCCPHGTKCDVSEGKCLQGNIAIDWFEKTPASIKDNVSVGSVVCPDGQHECPDGNTCCKLASGDWGCCPLEKAVCCSDHLHCCPHGTKCDVSEGKCLQGNIAIDWFEKTPASKKASLSVAPVVYIDKLIQNVVCPGGLYQCPDDYTCCLLTSGEWGCCPSPKAVCCDDHVHCCPHGMTCDVAMGKCTDKKSSIDWFENVPASKRDNISIENGLKRPAVSDVICPDGSCCEDGETCCLMSASQDHKYKTYGCCPLPDGVCCPDGLHCCPQNSVCDPVKSTCIANDTKAETDWYLVETPKKSLSKVNSVGTGPEGVICPDKKSQCPTGDTCCLLSDQTYGCCPYPNAVCCGDQKYCCPHGYVCDTEPGICRLPEKSASVSGFLKSLLVNTQKRRLKP